MKKISEYKNEEALDLLADIIDPVTKILTDDYTKKAMKSKNKIACISSIIKNHKKEVLEILAALEGVPVNEYECNILTLPARLIELLNDKELVDFFKSQGQMMEIESSGSAMENTTGNQV